MLRALTSLAGVLPSHPPWAQEPRSSSAGGFLSLLELCCRGWFTRQPRPCLHPAVGGSDPELQTHLLARLWLCLPAVDVPSLLSLLRCAGSLSRQSGAASPCCSLMLLAPIKGREQIVRVQELTFFEIIKALLNFGDGFIVFF